MSQVYKNLAAGPVPPSVPTSFVTDVNSPAIPALNILNEIGGSVTTNNINGIQTSGSSGGNTLTVELTNRAIGAVTTTTAALTTIITFPLAGSSTVYGISGLIVANDTTDGAGAFYAFDTAAKTNGAAATEIGTEYSTNLEDASLSASDIFVNVSGNSVLVQVQGVAGKTIDWFAQINYIQVS